MFVEWWCWQKQKNMTEDTLCWWLADSVFGFVEKEL